MKEESIRVAEAAMRGDVGQVMVAQMPRNSRTEVAAAPPPRPAAVVQVAAAPLPAPIPPLAQQPAPPPQPAPAPVPQFAAAPPPPAPALPVAAAERRWPSLIASAHAEPVQNARAAANRHSGRIFVQAGTFAVPENAQRVRAQVASLASTEIVRATVNGAAMYRVRLGPVASEAEARRLLGKVVDSGYPGARVIDE
jgi:hypothetical protein